MKHDWRVMPLGEALSERRETPTNDDLTSGRVRVIEKIGFNSGRIQLRANGSTKTGMILVRPGDLVVSGINAAKGAIAIHDVFETESVAATIHYGAYTPNRERADIRFLWWMLRSRFFRELLSKYVPGGIKTELKAKRLLPVPVPLPPLAEQRRIVARIEQLTTQINEARSLRRQTVEEAGALIRTVLHRLGAVVGTLGRLGTILDAPPRNGWSARCDNLAEGTPVLSLSAVTGFQYRSSEHKRTSLFAAPNSHFWLKPGDILITRSNTPELVGHAAIYDGNPAPCIYPDLMMRLELRDSYDRRFLWYWLQSPTAREFVYQNAKGTSPTMKKISQGIVMSIPFPVSLSLVEQQRIVAELDTFQGEVDTLIALQSGTAAELDALLPAILDRAFSGQL